MRRLLQFALFLGCLPLGAQVVISGSTIFSGTGGSTVTYVATAPFGSCTATPPIEVVISTGVIYTCNNGTWASAGGGGGGSFNGGTISGALFGPNINGEIYPANCGSSNPASWCSGTTPDAWYRAACTQLPASGGIINLLGLTGNATASFTCSTPTKQVITLQDPTSMLTSTQADGGVIFPQDNGSVFLGPGAGQCNFANGGIHLTSGSSVAAIVGPAHTDGSQENFTASGLCLYGASGATVGKGLIYSRKNFANTTISGNVVSVVSTAGIDIENNGQTRLDNNWVNVTDGINTVTGVPLIIQGGGTAGCEVGPIQVSGGQYEHALGGGPEIWVKGDGSGNELACNVTIDGVNIERNPSGTASSVGVQIEDCKNCSVSNMLASGVSAGSTSMVKIISNLSGSVANVTLTNISNVFGSYTNTLNDTTPTGATLTGFNAPFITTYYSNPGYVQPPVLPGTTLQAVGSDVMAGAGSFATGSGTLPTGFASTGCIVSGISCTFTRTASSPPPGYSYSEQVQITANTSGTSGFNGVQYSTPVSFVAGQSYIANFWAKGDGTFTGLPTALLWTSTTPVIYCQGTSANIFSTTWTLESFTCTPATSGSSNLAVTALTPINATGTFSVGGFTWVPVTPFTPGELLSSITPYGVGPATNAQQTVTVNSVPCQLGGSCSVAASGVPTVNTNAGPLVLSFSSGAGSCTYGGGTTTCTITGTSSGTGTVTNFIANSGSWPTWLVPTVTLGTTTPTLAVAASSIPNSALANPGLTLGSTALTLGATTAAVNGLQVNGVTLNGAGSSTLFLNQSGGYSTPAGTGTTTICSGTISLGTAAIASGAAATTVTHTCTGLASTDDIQMDFNGSPLGVVGYQPSTSGMLTIIKWPTTNTINVSVVNNTLSSVTPGAITLNYRVTR